MASSSQSLDFSFDALRDFGSRLFRGRPNEARKLARNRGGDHGLQFPRMGELAISTAESLLGLPGYVSDWLAQLFLAQKEIATDTCWKPAAPCRLDQHAPRRAIARLGDSALASRASAGMLGRNETQIGHELPRIGETGDVAEFRHQRRRGHQREATQRLQRLHHWRQRPVRKRGFDVGFKMIPPSRRRLDGRDAIFQHDVMRCVFERQSASQRRCIRVQAGRL